MLLAAAAVALTSAGLIAGWGPRRPNLKGVRYAPVQGSCLRPAPQLVAP
jgi:hypothetical protein